MAKDMTQTRDIFVGDYVRVPCRITVLADDGSTMTLVTVNTKGTETTLTTLTSNQVVKS